MHGVRVRGRSESVSITSRRRRRISGGGVRRSRPARRRTTPDPSCASTPVRSAFLDSSSSRRSECRAWAILAGSGMSGCHCATTCARGYFHVRGDPIRPGSRVPETTPNEIAGLRDPLRGLRAGPRRRSLTDAINRSGTCGDASGSPRRRDRSWVWPSRTVVPRPRSHPAGTSGWGVSSLRQPACRCPPTRRDRDDCADGAPSLSAHGAFRGCSRDQCGLIFQSRCDRIIASRVRCDRISPHGPPRCQCPVTTSATRTFASNRGDRSVSLTRLSVALRGPAH
jgi:hypothetical protein